jgi:iron complex transport system substrate-binding protein
MKDSRIGIAGLALAALALAGCGGSSSGSSETSTSGGPAASEPTSSAAATSRSEASTGASSAGGTSAGGGAGSLPATVETMFGPIDIPAPEDGELTVVALGWSDAEIALALGVQPVAVYDWQSFGEANKGVGPWATELFGDVQPVILANVGDSLDYETIQSLSPDLILNTRSAGDEQEYNRLSTIAPTVYAPEGTAAFATRWDVQTQQVADSLGLTEDGAAMVADVQAGITDAAAANPQFAGLTAVTATKFGDAYGAYIAGDARWDLIEALGFVQNPPVLELEATGFYVPVSVEQITALDAQIAVMFPIGYTLAEMQADPLIASLSVVQQGRTVFLEENDEVAQAFSAASPLSIPIALDGIVPQLVEIVPAS